MADQNRLCVDVKSQVIRFEAVGDVERFQQVRRAQHKKSVFSTRDWVGIAMLQFPGAKTAEPWYQLLADILGVIVCRFEVPNATYRWARTGKAR